MDPIGVFEYDIIEYPPQEMKDLVPKLNLLGQQGWRLVQFGSIGSTIRAIFMREVKAPA